MNWTPGGPIMGIWRSGSSHELFIVRFEKTKPSSGLPVIEKWEAYMLPNHSCFGAIEQKRFLEGPVRYRPSRR